MGLLEIKHHLMKVKMASLASLCVYFNTDAVQLKQMLNHWIRKGCVRQCMKTPACGRSCMKCDVPATEIYEWCPDRSTEPRPSGSVTTAC